MLSEGRPGVDDVFSLEQGDFLPVLLYQQKKVLLGIKSV